MKQHYSNIMLSRMKVESECQWTTGSGCSDCHVILFVILGTIYGLSLSSIGAQIIILWFVGQTMNKHEKVNEVHAIIDSLD